MKKKNLTGIIIVIVILGLLLLYVAKPKQAVDTSNIDKSELTEEEYYDLVVQNMNSGGPSLDKDDIPSIDNPIWLSVEESGVPDNEEIYGYFLDDKPRAIPQNIFYWHEILNEESASGEKLSVTYCPLTGTIIGYKGANLGVSGKLYNSNLVIYDRATDAEIPQILQRPVTGPNRGEKFENFYVYQTTWEQWKNKYPDTLVLSEETGFGRDYNDSPYPGYEDALRVWFPVSYRSGLFSTKKVVHGIENNAEFLAIPKSEFKSVGSVEYELGGDEITIMYDDELDVIKAYKDEKQINSFDSYWFAWYAYHPDTKVYNV